MGRPISIVWFERCYLGAVAIGIVNFVLQWGTVSAAATASMEQNPAAAQLGTGFATGIMTGTMILSLLISALLWYFTARKASVVTKWIVTVFFVLGVLLSLPKVVMGSGTAGALSGVLAVVALVLNGIAVWQLFKPDARVWFGEIKA